MFFPKWKQTDYFCSFHGISCGSDPVEDECPGWRIRAGVMGRLGPWGWAEGMLLETHLGDDQGRQRDVAARVGLSELIRFTFCFLIAGLNLGEDNQILLI